MRARKILGSRITALALAFMLAFSMVAAIPVSLNAYDENVPVPVFDCGAEYEEDCECETYVPVSEFDCGAEPEDCECEAYVPEQGCEVCEEYYVCEDCANAEYEVCECVVCDDYVYCEDCEICVVCENCADAEYEVCECVVCDDYGYCEDCEICEVCEICSPPPSPLAIAIIPLLDPADEPVPDFEELLPLLTPGDEDFADWQAPFGLNFPAGFEFVPPFNTLPGQTTFNLVEESDSTDTWNHFMGIVVNNAGGARGTIWNLPTPITDGARAFATFDWMPGTITGAGNVADNRFMSGTDTMLTIRTSAANAGIGFIGNDGFEPFSSIEGISEWQNEWFTFGILFDFMTGTAEINVIRRGTFDSGTSSWDYGSVIGTYTVSIAGNSITSFNMDFGRAASANAHYTGHGLDNLFFTTPTDNALGDVYATGLSFNVGGVSLTTPAALNLQYGEGAFPGSNEVTVTAVVAPATATDSSVEWALSSASHGGEGNAAVAEIVGTPSGDDDEIITIRAIGSGSITLTATALGSETPGAVAEPITINVTYMPPVEELEPDFEVLLPHLGAGDLEDWDALFGSNFPLGDFWGFSTSLANTQINLTSIAEEAGGSVWNHFMRVYLPTAQGGRRYMHKQLDSPVSGHRAFVTFDLRPGTVGGPAGNYADHALVVGDVPLFVIRNFQDGRVVASGGVEVGGTGADTQWNTLTDYTALESITNTTNWRDTWFTLGIELNFITSQATVTVMERGEFDTNTQSWDYGPILETYTVPIAGDGFDGFMIRTQRDSGSNIAFTGQGIDNLYFFSGDIPADWTRVGDVIDFADGVPAGTTNTNAQLIFTQSFAGQTVLNANPHATQPAANWGNNHAMWALPLNSGEWDTGDYNMVRVEFDFWTEWERQHVLGWEARFNSSVGTAPVEGVLFGVRGTSNGSHPANAAAAETFNHQTHLRMVTSESPGGNNRNNPPTTTLRSNSPRHTMYRVALEANLVTMTGTLVVYDEAGDVVSRQTGIDLPTDNLASFSFGAVRDGGNTWTGTDLIPGGTTADTTFGAKINNIAVFTATYGGVRPDIHPTGVTLASPAGAAPTIEFGPGSLVADRSATVTATVAPVNATNRDVTWSYTPDGRIELDVHADGSVTVTGLAAGTATLTATADMLGADSNPVFANMTITVNYVPAVAEPMPDFDWILDEGYNKEFGTNFDPADAQPTWLFTATAPRPPTGNGDWRWHARETAPEVNHYYRFETLGQAGERGTGISFEPIFGRSVYVNFDWRMPSGNVGGVRNSIALSVHGGGEPLISVRAGQAPAAFEFAGSPAAGWWVAAYSGPHLGISDERGGTFHNAWLAPFNEDRLAFLGGPGGDFGMNQQDIWYTIGMRIDMDTQIATVTMRPRDDADDSRLSYVEIPFVGTQVDGFQLIVERGPEQNHGLTGQGLDNLFFFTQAHEENTVVQYVPHLEGPPEPENPGPNAHLWQNRFLPHVYTGATLADLNLPASLVVITADGRTVTANVEWAVTETPRGALGSEFDSSVAGVFGFSGTLEDVPGQAYNRMNIVPRLFVEVRTQRLHNYARPMEWLDRGVVAVPVRGGGGNLVQWRLLVTEYAQAEPMRFNLYRNGSLIASDLAATNFVDRGGRVGAVYRVVPAGAPANHPGIGTGVALESNFLEIPVQRPSSRPNPAIAFGGTPNSPEGNPETMIHYFMNDMSVADVDGDGVYEILVRWTTNMQRDPGLYARHTGETIFDLYTLEGDLLWRINLGVNIVSGEHHSVMHFFDLDVDGFAEFAIKTAEGTRVYHPNEDGIVYETVDGGTPVYIIGGDGTNNFAGNFNYHALIDFGSGFYVGSFTSHPGNVWTGGTTCPVRGVSNTGAIGRINNGPEFFTVFNGLTGLPIDTVEYIAPYGILRGGWGDGNQNRSDRFVGAVAMMPRNGVSGARPWPTIIEGRQHYIPAFVGAYQLIDGRIQLIWEYDWRDWGSPGGGNHQMTVGDTTGNGYDDLIFGSVVLDYRGRVLWAADGTRGTINVGHGDALHMTAIFPGSSELYRMSPHEAGAPNNVTLFHAATGRPLWTHDTPTGDVGRGVMGNITPLPGFEVWASDTPIHNVLTGEMIVVTSDPGLPPAGQFGDNVPVNHMVYWTGSLTREFLDGPNNAPLSITGLTNFNPTYNTARRDLFQTLTGTLSNNGTKANPGLQADIFGDWREEIIVRRADNEAMRIYITDFPTDYTIYTLMHDPMYRLAVSWQNTVYNQPPHPSFYLGEAVRADVLAGNLPVPNVFLTLDVPAITPPPPPPPPINGGDEPGPAPAPAPTPAPAPAEPSTPEENHEDILNQIEDLEDEEYVSIVMPDGTEDLLISGETLDVLAENELGLVIVQGDTSVTVPADVIAELAGLADEDAEFRINITVTDDNEDSNVFAEVDIRAWLGDVEIPYVSGDILVETSVGFADMDLSGLNPLRFAAFDAEGNLVGGLFDEASNVFTFTSGLGSYTVAYVPNLRRIQLQIDSPIITELTQDISGFMDAVPLIIGDRTMVPIRFVAETIGAAVGWNPETYQVTIALGDNILTFAIGETLPGWDVPAQILGERTYVPIRFIIEFFGAVIAFDEATQTVNIVMVV